MRGAGSATVTLCSDFFTILAAMGRIGFADDGAPLRFSAFRLATRQGV